MIEVVKKLSPKAGDLVVLKYQEGQKNGVVMAAKLLADVFPEVQFFLVPHGVEVLDESVMDRLGWMRKPVDWQWYKDRTPGVYKTGIPAEAMMGTHNLSRTETNESVTCQKHWVSPLSGVCPDCGQA